MFDQTPHLYFSVLAISILHGILPNHWLPVIAISKQMQWSVGKTAGITLLAALAHSLSTVMIGVLLALGGMTLEHILPFFHWVAAGILVILGSIFIWRHQHHMHFHLREFNADSSKSIGFILGSLLLAMFLSPCLEVGALFIMAGTISMTTTVAISVIYTVTSAIGMTFFAWLAMLGLQRIDWHKIEHNSGLISGIVLILTGFMFLFFQ